jgi:hypothetical protein
MLSGTMTMRLTTDTAAPSKVLVTGVVVTPTCAHLAQGTEGTTVQITIGVNVILGMIAVMEQCMTGEALYTIVTAAGAEALFMIAMIGGEAPFTIGTR